MDACSLCTRMLTVILVLELVMVALLVINFMQLNTLLQLSISA